MINSELSDKLIEKWSKKRDLVDETSIEKKLKTQIDNSSEVTPEQLIRIMRLTYPNIEVFSLKIL